MTACLVMAALLFYVSRRVLASEDVMIRLDTLEDAYKKLRGQKARAASPGRASQGASINPALQGIPEEEMGLFTFPQMTEEQ